MYVRKKILPTFCDPERFIFADSIGDYVNRTLTVINKKLLAEVGPALRLKSANHISKAKYACTNGSIIAFNEYY